MGLRRFGAGKPGTSGTGIIEGEWDLLPTDGEFGKLRPAPSIMSYDDG
jgi:hypothetical protein